MTAEGFRCVGKAGFTNLAEPVASGFAGSRCHAALPVQACCAMYNGDMEDCRRDHGTWHEALALPDQVQPVTDDPQNSTRRLRQSERKLSVGGERRTGRLLVLAKARPKSVSPLAAPPFRSLHSRFTLHCSTRSSNDIPQLTYADSGIELALLVATLESHWN